MTPYQAQRIRFGILAARHALERARLTPDQADYLEGCEASGWRIKYSAKAFYREGKHASSRTARAVNFLPGDLVHIELSQGDMNICSEFHNRHGVITYGPDEDGGWIVSSAPGSLRCVAVELTMITPREDR